MAISITDYLQIDKTSFDETGALDSVLNVDTKMYVDISLLKICQVPELIGTYSKVTKRYEDILILLENSTSTGDKFWRTAKTKLHFNEKPGVCLGLYRKVEGYK